jgi:hypothetical protein
MQVMFQMLSSGAQTMLLADKRGTVLTAIVERSLADMINEHPPSDRNRWQDSILAALTQIKAAAVSDSFPLAIEFTGAAITLRARPAADSILPMPHVVRQLLAATPVADPRAATPQPGVSPSQSAQQSSGGAAGRKSGSKAGVVCRNWAATATCRFGSSCNFKDSHFSGGSATDEQRRAEIDAAGGGKNADAAPAVVASIEANCSDYDSAANSSGEQRGRGRGRGRGGRGRGGGGVDTP